MKKLTLLTTIILAVFTTTAQIINIPADYPTIQEGINAASEGDTVLVQPGTYYENITISNNITVASLYLTTEDPSYISQTVIDGGQQYSVVSFHWTVENALLCGFSLTNGNNSEGGGIKCNRTSPTLKALNIHNNSATTGGGIYCSYQSNPTLKNVKIAYNSADESGGGIYFSNVTYAIFDTTERCNIYLNNAKEGSDIYVSDWDTHLYVPLDTFTVLYPTRYHVTSRYIEQNENLILDILHGETEQINADLYVSVNGDDNASGLTPDDPLKTIYEAFYRILPDSLNPNTIHLAEGTYSTATNGESFPVVLIDYITLKGASQFNVILDANSASEVITEYLTSGTGVSDMTITGGYSHEGGGICSYWSSPTFKNLIIKNNHANDDGSWDGGGGMYLFSADALIENVVVTNNTTESGGGGICIRNTGDVHLKNTTVSHNSAKQGGGIFIGANVTFDTTDRCNIYLNSAMSGNDLYASYSNAYVVVDTFSVLYPTTFYAEPYSDFSFDIKTGLIQQISEDCYVSPDGDNNNSGLTEDEPFKTIHYAFSKLLPDSLDPQTVFLADGIYSQSGNGELFPVNMMNHMNIVGNSQESVILDAEMNSPTIIINGVNNARLSGLSVTGGKGEGWPISGGGINCIDSEAVLQNIAIMDNMSKDGSYDSKGGGIYCDNSDLVLNTVEIINNRAAEGGGIYYGSGCDLILQHVNIEGNMADEGGGIFSNYNSTISLNDVNIENNTADEIGGGAYLNRAIADLKNVRVLNNAAMNGGGICFYGADADLDNVLFARNIAQEKGGGLYIQSTNIHLKSVTVKENRVDQQGGGIFITAGGSRVTFDSIDRSNIYQNYAHKWGRDILSGVDIDVIVDTFTVKSPNQLLTFPMPNFQFDIMHGMYEQADADLFVSPEGDNENDGLTEDNPLKNIDVAMIKIIPNDTVVRTIHLMNGTYSDSLTGDIFPVFIPNHVNLKGESMQGVILDANEESRVIYLDNNSISSIDNLTVKGGYREGIYLYYSSPILSNLIVTENNGNGIVCDMNAHATISNCNISKNWNGIYCINSSNAKINATTISENNGSGIYCRNSNPGINNSTIINNTGSEGAGINCTNSSPIISNSIISNNSALCSHKCGGGGVGGGIYCENSNPEIDSVVIKDNLAENSGGGIYLADADAIITNVSITRNKGYFGGGLALYNSDPELKNIIISQNIAEDGGGLSLSQSNPSLSNVKITENVASGWGGAISCRNNTEIKFDSIDRCNIYLNNAGIGGNELYSTDSLLIVVDTFTVLYPTDYHATPRENFIFDIRYGLIEQVTTDVYISPDGDNLNSGTSSTEPLKNIRYGFSKMLADSLNPLTVHLMEGTYSTSLTNETFPISIPDFINLKGTSQHDVILDGGKETGLIVVYENPGTKISNLTATNGDNSYAIQLKGSKTILENLTIKNNYQGGLHTNGNDTSTLIYVTINNNTANSGGGINCGWGSYMVFDKTKRCNIYNNRALYGNDIYTNRPLEVYADTFSVLFPHEFHASPIDSITLDVNYGLYEQTNQDLHLSPEGNNLNSGLTVDEPIRNIHTALSKSLADSLHPQTLYLEEGRYSQSTTSEFYPVKLYDYISIKGAGMTDVILDAEGAPTSVIELRDNNVNQVSDITITGGSYSGIKCYNANPLIKNVWVTGNSAINGGGMSFSHSNPILKNVVVSNNETYDEYWDDGYGGGIFFYNSNPLLLNVSVTDNKAIECGGIYFTSGWDNNNAKMINSIVWNNQPDQLYLDTWSSEQDSISFTISYSNIMGGEEGIVSWDTTVLVWQEGNINIDPLFANVGDFPYALMDDSPCIDTGIPDTVGIPLTLVDALGSPRIWNDHVDMGAVEWNSLGEEEVEVTGFESQVLSYPNPFTTSTTIKYKIEKPGNINISIFNQLGEQVALVAEGLHQQGEFQFTWHADNLSPGVYYCVLKTNQGSQTSKLIKLNK